MTLEPVSVVARPIDRALSLLAAGEPEAALRASVALCEHEVEDAAAWFVLARSLQDSGHEAEAQRAFAACARRAIVSSHLPLAIAAAAALRNANGDAAQLFNQLARAYGRGSPLLAERRALPPELPGAGAPVEFTSVDDSAEALLGRALRVLDAEDARTPAEAQAKSLSPHPLFSSLPARELAEFAAIFEAEILPESRRVVEEGTLGEEAFVVARGELEVEKRAAEEGEPALHLARLGTGALFGEMALLSRSPRAASVIALRPSIVLIAKKEALDAVAETAPVIAQRFAEHCKRRMLENLMRTSKLFRSASAVERPALVERFGLRTFEPGEKLARQGQPSEGMHLIASGEVRILHGEGDDRTLLTQLGAGDVVGEIATILRRNANADAVVSHPTVTLFLPIERFLDLVRAHPKVFADLYELAVMRDEETQTISQEQAIEGEDFVLV